MIFVVSEVFLHTADAAERLLRHDAVTSRWDEPSSLEEYTVGGLSGHLARAVLTPHTYLAAPEPPPDHTRIDAAGYFLAVLGEHDPVDSEFHRAVRGRSIAAASDGPESLIDAFSRARRELQSLLADLPLDRRVEVLDGIAVTVDAYLRTRLVELVVHLDDLAVSIGLEGPPGLSDEAYRVTAGLLGEIAAGRAGGLETVRSLSRRERHPGAVRAL